MSENHRLALEYGNKLRDIEGIRAHLRAPKMASHIKQDELEEVEFYLDLIKERITEHYRQYLCIT